MTGVAGPILWAKLRGLYNSQRAMSVMVGCLLASVGCGADADRPAAKSQAPSAHAPAKAPEIGLNAGQRPPDFQAVDLQGKSHSLAAHQGEIVVLHFWATWCPYCRAEIPKLKQLVQTHAGDKVTVLAVSVDDDPARVREFVRAQQLPYPVISEVENQQPLSDRFRVGGIPTTYVINRQGLLVGRFQGQGDLLGAVKQLVSLEPTTS